MSHPIRFLAAPPLCPPDSESRHYDGTVDFQRMAIGDLCYFHYQGKPCTDPEQLKQMHLTAHYFSQNAKRPPLILALPDKAFTSGKLYFLVDGQCYSSTCTRCGQRGAKHVWDETADIQRCPDNGAYTPRGYYDGWTVSGEPPLITIAPSVNYDDDQSGVKHYHGFIQAGVIGDG